MFSNYKYVYLKGGRLKETSLYAIAKLDGLNFGTNLKSGRYDKVHNFYQLWLGILICFHYTFTLK